MGPNDQKPAFWLQKHLIWLLVFVAFVLQFLFSKTSTSATPSIIARCISVSQCIFNAILAWHRARGDQFWWNLLSSSWGNTGLPFKARVPGTGVITLHSRVSASFAVFLHYPFLATSTAAPLLPAGGFSLKGSLEEKLVCWPLRYKSKAQPVEPHL